MEKPPRSGNSRLGTTEREHVSRREAIFQTLKILVAEELEKNPQFNLTQRELDDLVKNNLDKFPPGINTGWAVMSYWKVAGFSYLKEKLGLPVKKRKEEY